MNLKVHTTSSGATGNLNSAIAITNTVTQWEIIRYFISRIDVCFFTNYCYAKKYKNTIVVSIYLSICTTYIS